MFKNYILKNNIKYICTAALLTLSLSNIACQTTMTKNSYRGIYPNMEDIVPVTQEEYKALTDENGDLVQNAEFKGLVNAQQIHVQVSATEMEHNEKFNSILRNTIARKMSSHLTPEKAAPQN